MKFRLFGQRPERESTTLQVLEAVQRQTRQWLQDMQAAETLDEAKLIAEFIDSGPLAFARGYLGIPSEHLPPFGDAPANLASASRAIEERIGQLLRE